MKTFHPNRPVVVVLPPPRQPLLPTSLVGDVRQQVGQHLENCVTSGRLLLETNHVVRVPLSHFASTVGVEVSVVEGELLLSCILNWLILKYKVTDGTNILPDMISASSTLCVTLNVFSLFVKVLANAFTPFSFGLETISI